MTKSKWVMIALLASLTVNLLLAGILIGRHQHPGFRDDPTRAFPRWSRTLPEDRQEALRPMLVEHLRSMRTPLRGMRERHEALRAAIQAEPFDPQQLDLALAQLRDAHAHMQEKSHSAFTDFVQQLTPAERAELLNDISKRRKPERKHWREREPAR